jgi:hypothetical protein
MIIELGRVSVETKGINQLPRTENGAFPKKLV